MTATRNSLPPGYALHWYLIKDILGQGGFGVTYLAEDTNLHTLVAIKEFLPVEMAVREEDSSVHPVSGEQGESYKWGLERFISEAQTLARFRHGNIVRVFTVFTENNTAYMVMEYEQGQGLHEVLKQKKRLSEREAMDVMLPILDGLEHVHAAGFIHRDIKPPNIFIRDSGTPVLLDFGSARQSLGEHTRTLTTMVSPGYAPFEQYVSKSDKQGPWTDIYGLGATLYRAVTGKSPPNALDRSEALLHTGTDILVPAGEICGSEYSAGLLRAIDHALAFKADDRPRDIAAWRAEIEDAFDTDTAEDETELLPPPHAAAPPAEVQTHRVGRNDETAARSAGAMHQAEPDRSSRSKSILKWLGGTAALILLSALLMHWPADRTETAPDPRITAGADGAIDPAPVGIEPAAVAGVPQTAGAASRQEPTPPAQPPVTTTAPDVLSADDRRKLALLRERLRANAEDDASDQLLQQTIKDYTDRAQAALDQGDQARAEAYVNQLRQVAPNNMKIEQALKKIRKAKFKKQGT